LIGVYGSGTAAGSNTVDAVEYYYAEFDSYFVTAQPDEVVKLDNGVFAGWARTGLAFKVHPIGTSGSLTVCRFYSVAFGLKSAHFYTPVADECARLKSNPDWIFEGEVFAIRAPARTARVPQEGSRSTGSTTMARAVRRTIGTRTFPRFATR
jgi:hypothetical protein